MTETDDELRARIINAYTGWGAMCSLVLEASGAVLDKLAAYVKIAPRRAEEQQ